MALPPGFVDTANQRYQEAKRFWGNWRGEARAAFAFVAGDQWLHEDMQILNNEKRPPITFNYSEKMIDAVVGAEVSSRQEISYKPREINDSPLAEMMTNAVKWVRDIGDIEDEESDAFRDALICGLGWTHTRVSYDTDPEGMIETHRVDSLEMLVDPAARKPALSDRRYSFRDMWVDEREARKQWPQAVLLGHDEHSTGQGVQIVRTGQGYNENDADEVSDNHKDQVQVRHYECVELRPYYRVQIGEGFQNMEAAEFNLVKQDLDEQDIKYVKMTKRVYYYAWFSGDTFLEGDESPTQEGFTYGCITGKRDRNKNTWYGLTKVMMDPQRWANKWLSQILHIINSNAKGGLFGEKGAFVDPKNVQEDYAKPNSILLLSEGGINKIKEKTMANYPSGLDKLMEFALASLPQVTGINLEALGLAGRDQANVLEQSRKQAAYGLLAPVFNSLRLYRKQQGRVMFDLIRNYISDGRMIRIAGTDPQQYQPLHKAPDSLRYDVIVDQSPNAPDIKEKTWQTLETLIPAAMKAGLPVPPGILKYAPIPTALATEWQQATQQAQQSVSPEAVQKLQEQMQQLQQQNQQLQMQLKDKTQELEMKRKAMEEELRMKREEMEFEHNLKMQELQEKMALEREQSELERTLQVEEAKAGIIMQKQQSDAKIEQGEMAAQNASRTADKE